VIPVLTNYYFLLIKIFKKEKRYYRIKLSKCNDKCSVQYAGPVMLKGFCFRAKKLHAENVNLLNKLFQNIPKEKFSKISL
jgi:hypothetical protein